jgi:methylenetetrahydrofolate dehydrogenase (NADP+) / methenyltetrahydrofolate cyclohydrolase
LPSFLPATPYGIIKLLEHYKIETSGKHTVVIGRSQIVGSPLSILMARNSKQGKFKPFTLTHSRTKNLKKLTLQADIIVAALGKTEFLTADMVKEGAIVIDVGITRVKSTKTKSGWKILGDVKFDEVAEKVLLYYSRTRWRRTNDPRGLIAQYIAIGIDEIDK